jgi:hypothetical protein
LIAASQSMNSGFACCTSTASASSVSPAIRRPITRSISGSVSFSMRSISASAAFSLSSTLVASAKMPVSLTAEAAYFCFSASMVAISGFAASGVGASTTSRTLMARSWTLPRKLIAKRCFTLLRSLIVLNRVLISSTRVTPTAVSSTMLSTTTRKPAPSLRLIVRFEIFTGSPSWSASPECRREVDLHVTGGVGVTRITVEDSSVQLSGPDR